ncbi:hypothetical protein ACMXN5_21870 [Embleya sp. MST-111070]
MTAHDSAPTRGIPRRRPTGRAIPRSRRLVNRQIVKAAAQFL